MRRIIYILLSAVVALTSLQLVSCKTAKMKDADEKYDRGEYYDASVVYRKIYNKLKNKEDRWQRGEVAFMLGECYRHLNMSARAAAAYQNSIRYEYGDTLAYLYLAQAQQMEGQYSLAAKNYEMYLDMKPGDHLAEEGLRACRMAPSWKDVTSRYIVKQAKQFNSRRADFCPQFLDGSGEMLYFTSSNEKAMGTVKSEITGTKNSDVFFSKKDDKGKWSRPAPAEGELNTEFDEGVTCFTPDGMTMYLSKAIRKTDSPTSVEIYSAQRSEAKWSAPVKFEITADTLSAYGDPAVSPDGQWLYFSSDMPGGQGGKDLWRVRIKDGHGTLENLGDQINTSGDERFPYCRTDSVLYFSSTGHAGFGGLDIYKATLQPSGKWFIENMGAPVNSSWDDFGITFDRTQTEAGYFSSNRKDGRGYDHIFSFEKPDLKIWISGYVLDKDEEPVPNAIIRIVGNDGSNQKAVSKPDGTFRFDLQRGVSYVMLAGANGYLNGKQEFTSDLAEADAEYNVDFILAAMTKPQVIENIFYDYNKATLRPESKAALDSMVQVLNDNPYVSIEMSSHTDRIGGHEFNMDLSTRRAKSVVDYLIAHGIEKERLTYQGYGKTRPKVVTKRIARLYPQFQEGDTLTVAYIDTLSKENKAAADQINRRTEFQVITTNYFQTFGQDTPTAPGTQEESEEATEEPPKPDENAPEKIENDGADKGETKKDDADKGEAKKDDADKGETKKDDTDKGETKKEPPAAPEPEPAAKSNDTEPQAVTEAKDNDNGKTDNGKKDKKDTKKKKDKKKDNKKDKKKDEKKKKKKNKK